MHVVVPCFVLLHLLSLFCQRQLLRSNNRSTNIPTGLLLVGPFFPGENRIAKWMYHISCNFHIVIFFVTTYLAAGKILTRMWELFWIWLYVCCLLFMFYWIMSTQDKNHQDLSIMPNSIMLYIFHTKSLMLVHSIASLLFLPSLFLDQWLHNRQKQENE